MYSEQETGFATILRGRMATYRFLSRLFRVEADQELLDTLRSMHYPASTGTALVDEGYRLIRDYLSTAGPSVLTELAVDYVRTFIGSGNSGYSAAYPYESVYTSPKRLMMQDARDEVLALYRAAGLAKQESWKEGEDHLALELEFEHILVERSLLAWEAGDTKGCERYLVRQRDFLKGHLLSWYPMMAKDIEKFSRTGLYRGLGKLTSGYLQSDLELLDEILSGSGAAGTGAEGTGAEGTGGAPAEAARVKTGQG
jgi:TorA maturation chaperone TorD